MRLFYDHSEHYLCTLCFSDLSLGILLLGSTPLSSVFWASFQICPSEVCLPPLPNTSLLLKIGDVPSEQKHLANQLAFIGTASYWSLWDWGMDELNKGRSSQPSPLYVSYIPQRNLENLCKNSNIILIKNAQAKGC